MAKERTYAGKFGEWKRLLVPLDANITELGHLEVSRAKLAAMLARAEELSKQQGAFKTNKQEASKELARIAREGQRLANALRTMLKEHYGIDSEKLAQYGLQPFRGRPRTAKPAPEKPQPPNPTPPPVSEPTAPSKS